jgi:hypothetical protein
MWKHPQDHPDKDAWRGIGFCPKDGIAPWPFGPGISGCSCSFAGLLQRKYYFKTVIVFEVSEYL